MPRDVPPDFIAGELTQADRVVLIRTVAGEARGERDPFRTAVVHVVRNRVIARGSNAATECLRPWQFSCWNLNDPNRQVIERMRPGEKLYEELAVLVARAWREPDTTKGSRHYYCPRGMPIDPGTGARKVPVWAIGRKPAVIIGPGYFFAGVP